MIFPGLFEDEHFEKVSLLLHFDGAPASTTLLDSSQRTKTVTAYGGAQIDAVQAWYGSGCLALNGSTAYVEIADAADFYFDTNTYTIEGYLRLPATISAGTVLAQEGACTLSVDASGYLHYSVVGGISLSSSAPLTAESYAFFNVSVAAGAGTLSVDGSAVDTDTSATAYPNSSAPLLVGATDTGGTKSAFLAAHLDDLRITKGVARAADVPSGSFPDVDTPADYVGWASAPGPLGAAALLAGSVRAGRVACPGPLGAPAVRAYHDFTATLGDYPALAVMDLLTPGGPVRLPVSSWQATLRAGSASYLQCVVPACGPWVGAIEAATEFVISLSGRTQTGLLIEHEMARAPADTVQFDQGPQRFTCTLSGYSSVAFEYSAAPDPMFDRTLKNVRSVSRGGKMRVRCAVDWLLRPGERAYVGATPLLVGYINYYYPSTFDAYMDVGEA